MQTIAECSDQHCLGYKPAHSHSQRIKYSRLVHSPVLLTCWTHWMHVQRCCVVLPHAIHFIIRLDRSHWMHEIQSLTYFLLQHAKINLKTSCRQSYMHQTSFCLQLRCL